MTGYSTAPPSAVPALDQPHYGIGPIAAVARFYRKYATFSGRASRSEYWWIALVFFVVYLVLGLATFGAGLATGRERFDGTTEPGIGALPFALLLVVISLASIVPNIALAVRRLHDCNFSGLLYLITFVPYLGGLALVVLAALPSNPLGARYDAGQNGAYPAAS
jgi:uncharacterized membrane protein YhaH (DUF805 family)